MSTTLDELARLVGGELLGDPQLGVTGAATLETAGPGQITFVDSSDRAKTLAASPADAALVPRDFPPASKPVIVVDDVLASFTAIVNHFRPPRTKGRIGVCAGAIVSPTARLGKNVDVHPGATIGDHVVVGDDATIHAGVHIMDDCVIGANATLFPGVVLYEGTRIGDRCLIHAGAVLGAYGFGYRSQHGKHELSAQLGYVDVGDDVEIGACSTIDRGTFGPTTIGSGTKIDNLVMIAHNCRIGRHNLICSQVGIAGSSSTGDYVVMAGQAGIKDHVRVGSRTVIGSKSGVVNDIGDDEVVLGQPAIGVRQQKLQIAALARLPEMRRQFRALLRQLAPFLGDGLATPLSDGASLEATPSKPHDQAA